VDGLIDRSTFNISGTANMATDMTISTLIVKFTSIHSTLIRYPDLETFLREDWEADFLTAWDANDMLCLLQTWKKGDVSTVHYGGDLGKCLSEVKPKGLIMPSKTDLYFAVRRARCLGVRVNRSIYFRQPEDSEIELLYLRNTARLVIIESIWGHTGM
jgi:homoserine O-acetyltransferase